MVGQDCTFYVVVGLIGVSYPNAHRFICTNSIPSCATSGSKMEEKKDYRLQRKVWKGLKVGRVATLSWTIHNVLEIIKEDTERFLKNHCKAQKWCKNND